MHTFASYTFAQWLLVLDYQISCYRMLYLCDISNEAFDWFLSVVVKNGEFITEVTEH